MRERQCLTGDCLGNDTQTEDHCSDCNYSKLLHLSNLYYLSPASCGPWSDWGSCPDSSCSQIRTKKCTETCDEGEIESFQSLDLTDILPDHWSPWSSWSSCSHSCGGSHSRSRHCIRGNCTTGTSGCPGEDSETQSCSEANQGRLR